MVLDESSPSKAPTLDELAKKYGTDKASSVNWRRGRKGETDPFVTKARRKTHNYCNLYYEPRFGPIRYKRVRLLELGVLWGQSLRMWQEYFPHGQIFGIDKTERAMIKGEDRIRTFMGDQKDPAGLAKSGEEQGSFDVVIDDASHLAPHQTSSLRALWPFVKFGGWYVIEDINNVMNPDRKYDLWSRLADHLQCLLYGESAMFCGSQVTIAPHILFIQKAK